MQLDVGVATQQPQYILANTSNLGRMHAVTDLNTVFGLRRTTYPQCMMVHTARLALGAP